MVFKSTGVAVEVVVYNGRRYRRYPESPREVHRRYFGRSGALLHRDVWKFHNGPIPQGYDIHHKNGDPGDNRIENLECLSRKEHFGQHEESRRDWLQSKELREHLDTARVLATEWHRSPEGRAWHRENAKTSLCKPRRPGWYNDLPDLDRACTICGAAFTTKNAKRVFCGHNCAERSCRENKRKTILTAPRSCALCGAEFYSVYRRKKYCTRACCQRVAMQRHKARIQSDS